MNEISLDDSFFSASDSGRTRRSNLPDETRQRKKVRRASEAAESNSKRKSPRRAYSNYNIPLNPMLRLVDLPTEDRSEGPMDELLARAKEKMIQAETKIMLLRIKDFAKEWEKSLLKGSDRCASDDQSDVTIISETEAQVPVGIGEVATDDAEEGVLSTSNAVEVQDLAESFEDDLHLSNDGKSETAEHEQVQQEEHGAEEEELIDVNEKADEEMRKEKAEEDDEVELDDDDDDVSFLSYNRTESHLGEIFWAALPGSPYWPGIVCVDDKEKSEDGNYEYNLKRKASSIPQ